MQDGFEALTEREKDTLRLLLGGHDAKSIARTLDLSVHTVNERLRDARRKLGVSSSREAARLVAEADRDDPNSLADKRLGVGGTALRMPSPPASNRRRNVSIPLAWLGGGMLIMSLVIAAIALSSVLGGDGDAPSRITPTAITSPVSSSPSDAATRKAALAWVDLLDKGRWDASWDAAGTLFKSQLSKAGWSPMAQSVREPLGPVSSRVMQAFTVTTSLPNSPAGEYAILQFQTNFAHRPNATETVILAHEATAWKVAGYFIR